jgi:hypothetical protein
MEYSTMESLGREKPAGTRELRRTPWILSDPFSTSPYIYKTELKVWWHDAILLVYF